MKGKIIINYDSSLSDEDVIRYVKEVIEGGRISVGANGKKHYCWATIFNDDVVVEVKPKYKTDSNIFVVSKLKQ